MSEFQRLPEIEQCVLKLLRAFVAPLSHQEIVRKISQFPAKPVSDAIKRLAELDLIERYHGCGWQLSMDGARLFQSEPQPTPPLQIRKDPTPEGITITAADLEAALALDDALEPHQQEDIQAETEISAMWRRRRDQLEAELEALQVKQRLDGAQDAAWLLNALAKHHQETPAIASELVRVADFIQRGAEAA